jgi:hypothetical protein
VGLVVRQHQVGIDQPDQLGCTAAGRAEHRRTAGHAFEDGQRQVLEHAAADLQVGGLHERAQAGRVAVADQVNPVGHAVGGDELFEPLALGAAAGDDQLSLEPAGDGHGERGDQPIELFDASQAADPDHQRFVAVWNDGAELGSGGGFAGGWAEVAGVDAGGNDAHPIGGVRSAGADLSSGKVAHRHDPGGQREHAPFDASHVAPQELADEASRLDPLRVELGMEQKHQRRAGHHAGPAQRQRGVVRPGDGHGVRRKGAEGQSRADQVGHVAHGRVWPPDGIQPVTDVGQRREAIVQPRGRHGDRMAPLAEAAHRLVRVAVAAEVVWQEQVPGKQDRATRRRQGESG